jgi:tetratricopeptide (TPR) repeat protein
MGNTRIFIGLVFLQLGQRKRAEHFFREVAEIAERTSQPNLLLTSMALEGFRATLNGRLEEAVDIGQSLHVRATQLGPVQYGEALSLFVSYIPMLYLGRLDDIFQQYGTGLYSQSPFLRINICQEPEAINILEHWVLERPNLGTEDDETPGFLDVMLLQGAVRIGHRPAAQLLLGRFAGSSMHIGGISVLTCIPRHMGAAAALLGRQDEARKYYDEAIKVTTEMPFRPELALTRLQMAELLLEHYPAEKADALDHLDFAIKEFREMKMQPSLERAEKLHSEKSQK